MKRFRLTVILFMVSAFVLAPAVGNAHSEGKNELPTNTKTPAKALVVIYSHTGNTRAVADEIVKRFETDIVIIKAKKYEGSKGKIIAGDEALKEVTITDIEPEKVDLSQYNLIFLGSPIWWFGPAVPLWTFVEKNDFSGTKVVLFNTFNSRFKSENIVKFEKLVKSKGGIFYDHIYVRRGFWYYQLSREELLEKFSKLLDAKEKKYNSLIFQRK